MAVPRVFISSTYYDLKHVRNNIGSFIRSLGYDSVMHEKSDVPYTQDQPLEVDCYHEISGCDIVVCIVGNNFGTKSNTNNFSITMNEIKEALRQKKKVYIFIAKDVDIENRTYEKNIDNKDFKPACVDNLDIHKFILELKKQVKSNPITAFETTDEIIETLKKQFAGLFQNLLVRETTLTEEKTVYDLQETVNSMKEILKNYNEENIDFRRKFDSTYFRHSLLLTYISHYLGFKEITFFIKTISELDDFMDNLGYIIESDMPDDICRIYTKVANNRRYSLCLKNAVINEYDILNKFLTHDEVKDNLIWTEEEFEYTNPFNDNMPF